MNLRKEKKKSDGYKQLDVKTQIQKNLAKHDKTLNYRKLYKEKLYFASHVIIFTDCSFDRCAQLSHSII